MNYVRGLLLFALALCLSACQTEFGGNTGPQTTSSPEIAVLPTEENSEMPAPEGGARVMEASEQKVLASQNGDFEVHLKPAGENLEVDLIKAGTVDNPGFSTGAISGPQDFEGRIMKDLEMHPEFRNPLLDVLRMATEQPPAELGLTPAHQEVAKSLLEALEK